MATFLTSPVTSSEATDRAAPQPLHHDLKLSASAPSLATPSTRHFSKTHLICAPARAPPATTSNPAIPPTYPNNHDPVPPIPGFSAPQLLRAKPLSARQITRLPGRSGPRLWNLAVDVGGRVRRWGGGSFEPGLRGVAAGMGAEARLLILWAGMACLCRG